MREERELEEISVIIAGVCMEDEADFKHSMEELKSLAKACGRVVCGMITQKLDKPDQAYFVGSGKVEEIAELAEFTGAQQVIFDDTLSPAQHRNLGNRLKLTVLDRTGLILEIFALRAGTKEAKLQVEMAQLQYMLPRLIGMREELGRQGGASGAMSNKGAGETKLELDRRRIEHRISELRKELTKVEASRATLRKRRNQTGALTAALVGYTNAGKSTIMNHMVARFGVQKDKTVLEKDMLFATLDTNVRGMEFADNRNFLLADTVGFIHKLPHGLVKAFRATLDEVCFADLLVQVVDYSDENHKQHMEVTAKTLQEIDAGAIPMIIVYNKADLTTQTEIPKINGDTIYMAANADSGIEELSELIRDKLYAGERECRFLIPYDRGSEASYLMEHANIRKQEYLPEGIMIEAGCTKEQAGRFEQYLVEK